MCEVVRQSAEFSIIQGGWRLSPLLLFVTDARSLGLNVALGHVGSADKAVADGVHRSKVRQNGYRYAPVAWLRRGPSLAGFRSAIGVFFTISARRRQ